MIRRCDLVPQYKAYKKQIDAVIKKVLLSGRYINDGEVKEFESDFARYLNAKYAIAVGNGTDGLVLSLMAIGIKKGDEVITTPFTAIPTLSAIIDAGARPVFADISTDTFLIDSDKVAQKVNKKTKAIIPVHIFGNVVDVKNLKKKLSRDIPIIEDACQAHGSTIASLYAGNCGGDIGVFSFYPTKNLGAYGDGGLVVTNNEKIAKKIRLLRTYGMTDKDHIVCHGINSRLDELQAALLCIKLRYLDRMNEQRNRIASRYKTELRGDLFAHQQIPSSVYSNYHIFASQFRMNRDKFVRYLDRKRIQTNVYYPVALHLQEANKYLGFKRGLLPCAEALCETVIALPMYPEMTERIQNRIIETINKYKGY